MFRRVIKGTQIIYLWTRNLSMAKNKIKKSQSKEKLEKYLQLKPQRTHYYITKKRYNQEQNTKWAVHRNKNKRTLNILKNA